MKWGKINYKDFINLRDKLQEVATEQHIQDLTNQLAQRLFAKVVKRTPVGQYASTSGKKGGTLRRGWTMTQVRPTGGGYEVKVINPTDYASYVEYGHRTRNHEGWVEGQFFLTKSEIELERELPKIIERKIQQILKEAFNDK